MYQTKSAFAAAKIREALASGRYAPGERLQAKRVAEDLNLSLTPVREALLSLATEGLVVMAPHRGATVAEYSEGQLAEVFAIRAQLESYATEKAAAVMTGELLAHLADVQNRIRGAVEGGRQDRLRELNDDFHFSIYQAAGSELLERLIRQAWAAAPRDLFSLLPERGQGTVVEHDVIVAALRAGDPVAAGAAMRAHLESSLRLQQRARSGGRPT